MLKTRIITAVALLAVLLPVLFFNYFPAFALVVTLFVGAAVWEGARLFGLAEGKARVAGVIGGALFVGLMYTAKPGSVNALYGVAALLWIIRYAPTLGLGLPQLGGAANWSLAITFTFAVFACFFAIVGLYLHSPLFLLSVMVLVWIADIGAYFSGKAFGKRKLAPTISPGKSWEGAIGGAIAVLAIAALSVILADSAAPWLQDTFTYKLHARFGWSLTLLILLVIVMFSVIGDLFESALKRRAGMKDSSNLLPGHGGVLDRVDALIPVLPMAALVASWL
ncbi:phosphatidate cytidylyltransferase [Duganella sp. CF402]|uniref:phosphatidate cytidylyltransferase n=1 Tax=unclassified Duganella TaxID=2636909 RepID=UPI0008BD94E2|nr:MULTISPECIES: phosphatidate cytidylyltransferase [unclassified Duganella]RZT10136.1 phosphatidate cytidylyltransferase [Duganella sp. BK701]SEL26672.1 phosphatidate cytidylyltransferase [Duganella sp. CF402]